MNILLTKHFCNTPNFGFFFVINTKIQYWHWQNASEYRMNERKSCKPGYCISISGGGKREALWVDWVPEQSGCRPGLLPSSS